LLTRLRIRNLKRFDDVSIELGSPVVFVGPNNSGKTTALQALALWQIGVRKWVEKRGGRDTPEKRPGVTINRQDLISIPVPEANLLWRNLHVRDVETVRGKPRTSNVRIDVQVDGVTEGAAWSCGLEFDFANAESFYCRPLRVSDGADSERMPVPLAASGVRVAFLPPMSGLAATETRLDPGAVNVRLGEGRTAEVLRNLCYLIVTGQDGQARWERLAHRIHDLFGVELDPPRYVAERGEIEMTYREARVVLDLSSSGRGLQQTLLLLAHMAVNPGAVLLLDEPDAHLEILRQRQTYQLLTQVAQETESQVVAASHSEVVLNEAAERDLVIAFVGAPHRIDDRGSQLLKALKEIGFEQYALAEQTGWVLYLEGSTDLAILQALAESIGHPAVAVLQRPFVDYVLNKPQAAVTRFAGLQEARPDLVGYALFDRLARNLPAAPNELRLHCWARREIENYIDQRHTLLAWAQAEGEQRTGGPLFAVGWRAAMEEAIEEVETALRTLGKLDSPNDLKASDDYLAPIFAAFYRRLGLPNLMNKSDYQQLARFVDVADIDAEIVTVLDAIAEVAAAARPRL
jgi:ABC-type taurine transport system ATPase subunit